MRARASGETAMRSISTSTGSAKFRSSSDSGVENSKTLPVLIKPVVAALAQLEQPLFQPRIVRRLGRLLLCDAPALRLLRLDRLGRRLHREEHLHARSFSERENPLRHFIHRVLLHLLPAVQAVGAAHAGIQQAQIVVDLGRGGDRRARIARGVLLPDGDGGSDAVDDIDVGLLDALQKLPRVGGKRLHVAALALGVNGVERQRRLARSRNSRHHRHGVVRNFEVDVLQIVDARSAYDDALVRHGPQVSGREESAGSAAFRLPAPQMRLKLAAETFDYIWLGARSLKRESGTPRSGVGYIRGLTIAWPFSQKMPFVLQVGSSSRICCSVVP